MEPHLSTADIELMARRRMPPAKLLAADSHLAGCAPCRLAVASESSRMRAQPHPAYDSLEKYVDGLATEDERKRIAAHIEECVPCRTDLADLDRFRNDLQANLVAQERQATRKAPERRLIWRVAAAGVALVGVAWMSQTVLRERVLQESHRGRAVTLRDRGRTISIGSDGTLVGLEGAPEVLKREVARVLGGAALAAPPEVADLAGAASLLMGGAPEAQRFTIVSPVATAVLSDRPVLTWMPVSDARTYSVLVTDDVLREVARSPALHATSWTPPPLPRDREYSWQVTASTSEGTIVAPAPPQPEARFRVLAAAEAARVEGVRARLNSRLAAGVLLAGAGLLEDAERELNALEGENPRSAVAQRLLRQVRALRGAR